MVDSMATDDIDAKCNAHVVTNIFWCQCELAFGSRALHGHASREKPARG
jgi:hypothetical protein